MVSVCSQSLTCLSLGSMHILWKITGLRMYSATDSGFCTFSGILLGHTSLLFLTINMIVFFKYDVLFRSFCSFYVDSCQTYEGGFAGLPGMEAHGGYSFCGLAALIILNKQRLCDQRALLVSTFLLSFNTAFLLIILK